MSKYIFYIYILYDLRRTIMSPKKLTLEQKLYRKSIKKPNFIYNILGAVLKKPMYKKYGIHIIDHVGMKDVTEQHIFISNHTSRIDYFFNAFNLLPNRYNWVVGYNEFFRKKFVFIFNLLHSIPKKNFSADMYTMKEMIRIKRAGGNIAIFPEGMNSIGGMNQPVALGTGKFIKKFGLPVYYSVIRGGYLTVPKYAADERPGYIEVEYNQMFTKEELNSLSAEEITDIMNEKLYHDDYAWNKEQQHSYHNQGLAAEHIHDLLYRCPKCGGLFTLKGHEDTITCSCGNEATFDDKYNLIPKNENCIIPSTPSEWFKWEREQVRKDIQDPSFSFTEHVKLGTLPKYEMIKDYSTSFIVGEGDLTIDKTGLTYDGTRDNQPYHFHINSINLPTYGMCNDVTKIYTFLNNEFLEFYPTRPCTEYIVMLTEEYHRLNGGKWQDFKFKY